MKFSLLAASIALGLVLSPPVQVRADGGDDDVNPTTRNTTKKCKKGKVWDKKKKRCVKKSSELDQESIFEAGRDLAKADRFNEAIGVLTLAPNLGDKRILNYLGYSHRKLGRVEIGLGYYRQALKIDPDYSLVREYMGEALLQKKDLAGARTELAEIERICKSRTCHEYEELFEEIEAFVKQNGG